MSGFEAAFSLFGLLLGLSLAEVLGGLGRAVEAHRTFRLGWLTPLLGLLVILDIVAFWLSAWNLRDHIVFSPPTLLAATVFGGGYYLAAYLVFPRRAIEAGDLNDHYFAVRRPVLSIMATASLIQFINFASVVGWRQVASVSTLSTLALLETLFIASMFTRGARTSAILLAATVAFYLFLFFI